MTKKIVKDKFKKTPALEVKAEKEVKPKLPTPEPVKESEVIEALKVELKLLQVQVEENRVKTIEEIREANSKREPDVLEPVVEGFKNPSISTMRTVYTKEQYKKLMASYKKQNPAKYKLKEVELEAKLKRLK